MLSTDFVPLSERVRPKTLKDFVGQKHILSKGKPLYEMIKSGNISSIILWGSAGTGKTTLAKIISNEVKADFFELNAVSSGVKDVREVIKKAKENKGLFNKRTILFIDEIHRFNKSQQDALLHSVEDGTVTLIGATTENPSFEIVTPLLSRCQVFILEKLKNDELNQILERALKEDFYLSKLQIEIEDRDLLFSLSDGDGRVMLNRFEMAVNISKKENDRIFISNQIIKDVFQKQNLNYDKNGDEHYNLISAFIKSIRGSDPDGAVYYLARMLEGGEDPKFIARRLIILASEDIGNAEPYALTLATSCFNAVSVVGMPESRIILSQVATYLASCPKSNASYLAIEKAIEDVKNYGSLPVPLHLRNAPTKFLKNLGYGKGYKYSHNFENHFVKQMYLPDKLKSKVYYKPSSIGREKVLKERLINLWKGFKQYKD